MEWRKEDKEALRAQRWFPAFQARLGGDKTAQFKGVLCYAPVKRPLLPKSMCKSFGEGEDGAAPTGSGIMALEQNTGGRCERPASGASSAWARRGHVDISLLSSAQLRSVRVCTPQSHRSVNVVR